MQETKVRQKVQNDEKAHVALDFVLPLSTRCSQNDISTTACADAPLFPQEVSHEDG